MNIFSNEWAEAMKLAYYEGLSARSILDNPYWKKYPVQESEFEESKARHWVDGYYERLKNEASV